MSCRWGWIPLLALSTCNASHAHTHVEQTSSGNEALEILKQRYAKGEINKETFLEMKKIIE